MDRSFTRTNQTLILKKFIITNDSGNLHLPGSIAELVAHLTADPGVRSQLGHVTFLYIDNEIISVTILPPADSRRAVVSYVTGEFI